MYAYIKGIIKEIKANYVIIDNNNIGYMILVPNPYNYQIGEDVLIYTHHHIREDINALYGFRDNDSKDLFLSLIGVKGIGPKTALSILAADKIDEIVVAIETGDVKLLKKFPGIGIKTAQQIILDLKGKLVTKETLEASSAKLEATEALASLGYTKREIKKALSKLDSNLSVEELVKKALQKIIS